MSISEDSITAEDIAWYVSASYVECPECNGNGEHYRQNYGYNAMEDLTYLGVCRRCNGTGEGSVWQESTTAIVDPADDWEPSEDDILDYLTEETSEDSG
jgi:hypothetical protein